MKSKFFLAFFFLCSISIYSQTFNKGIFGQLSTDHFHSGSSVIKTSDGGFLFVGERYKSGNNDAYLIKTDASGNLMWHKIFFGVPTNNWDDVYDMVELNNGNFLLVGTTQVPNSATDALLFCVDNQGQLIWSKGFGTLNNNEGIYNVKATSDGGFVIVSNFEDKKIVFAKFSSAGNIVFSKVYTDSNNSVLKNGHDVVPTSDGGFAICGSYGNWNNQGYLIIKTDNAGTIQWAKNFADNAAFARSIVQTSDGGFIVSGSSYTYSGGLVFKLSSSGDITWGKVIRSGANIGGGASCIRQTSDNGYIVLHMDDGATNPKSGLIKLDASGNTLWSKEYNKIMSTLSGKIIEYPSGGYVFTGSAKIYGWTNDNGIYITKTDANGNNCASTSGTYLYKSTKLPTITNLSLITSSPSIPLNSGVLGGGNSSSVNILDRCNCPVNAGPDKTNTQGCCGPPCTSVQIGTPSSGYNYSWSPITDLSCSNCAQPFASPCSTTDYTLTVGGSCLSSSDIVKVTNTPYVGPSCCKMANTNGIENQNELSQISFYPNPANREIIIISNGDIDEISIYDLCGKEVSKILDCHLKEIKLDVSHLTNSIYFISFKSKEQIKAKKLIITH